MELLQKGKKILEDTIQEVRALSQSLVANSVKEIGLIKSVSDLIDTIRHNQQLDISFQAKGFSEKLPAALKLTLFRIIQEQLNNIQKHAAAHSIIINLTLDKENLTLLIADDGKGFDTKKKSKGIGLSNIASRTRMYNGSVDIRSTPGKGTDLVVVIPDAGESQKLKAKSQPLNSKL
jgi:signal transduction histidine kinase